MGTFINLGSGGGGGGIIVAGTGTLSSVRCGVSSTASGDYSFAVGKANSATGNFSSVSGGASNTASGLLSTISGGEKNLAQAFGGFIGGGNCNSVCNVTSGCLAYGAVVVGGVGNNTTGGTWSLATCKFCVAPTICNAGQYSFVGGGFQNRATGSGSSVLGGCCNIASGFSSISIGQINTSSGNSSLAVGRGNTASNAYATTFGRFNTNSGYASTIGGGAVNINSGIGSFIGAGCCNTLSGNYSFIGSGCMNKTCYTFSGYAGASNYNDVINGGLSNCISVNLSSSCSGGYYSGGQVIGGGQSNCIVTSRSGIYLDGYGYNTIGGGINSRIFASCYNTISGGSNNAICGFAESSSIVGGAGNTINGNNSVIGGFGNTSSGSATTIFGENNIIGAFSCAHIIGTLITADRCCTTFVNNLSIKSIPTSAAGLPSGSVWKNGNVLNIV
jgi:hypothetical protein